jgi:hypothetical protein
MSATDEWVASYTQMKARIETREVQRTYTEKPTRLQILEAEVGSEEYGD